MTPDEQHSVENEMQSSFLLFSLESVFAALHFNLKTVY